MEAFLYGIRSILSLEAALFMIFSFLLIGKLSSFFGSHLVKVAMLSTTTVFMFMFFVVLSPTTAFELLRSLSVFVLVLTIIICLKLLGIIKMIKSQQLRANVDGVFNWFAPIVFGYWLFAQSFLNLGPLMSPIIIPEMSIQFDLNVELIPLFFGLGVVLAVGGVLTLSWFFHDKFKGMQFWKVIQGLASVVVIILSLRILIEAAIY